MKKSERLELENKVLKNMLENIQCEIGLNDVKDYEDRLDPYRLIGRIEAFAGSFDERMEFAEMYGYLEFNPTKEKMEKEMERYAEKRTAKSLGTGI